MFLQVGFFFFFNGFVDRYCLNMLLSWNILFSPLMVIESFVGNSSPGLHPCPHGIYSTSTQNVVLVQNHQISDPIWPGKFCGGRFY